MDLDQIKTEASKDLIIVNEEQLGSESLKNQKIKAKYLDTKVGLNFYLQKVKVITNGCIVISGSIMVVRQTQKYMLQNLLT